jgi:membrane protein YdbS with pleckstrin-like domain
MKKLNPKAIKILFYRIATVAIKWSIPVFILLVIFIHANYLLHIFVISIFLLSTLFGSWLWAKYIVNKLFAYEITQLGIKMYHNYLFQTNETIPFNQILDISVNQNSFDQKLGLYSLKIKTKNRSKLSISIFQLYITIPLIDLFCGFSREEAEKLRDEILFAKQNQKETIIEKQNIINENSIQVTGQYKLKYFLYGFSILCIIMAVASLYFFTEDNELLYIYVPSAILFVILGFFSEKIVKSYYKNTKVNK